MNRTSFEKLGVYELAEEMADLAWHVVSGWTNLARDTLGKQWIRSADSIGANLAEGLGRGSPAENRRYAKIAGGSLFEVKHWLRRASKRGLLSAAQASAFQGLVDELTPKLSAYIGSIGTRSTRTIRESRLQPNTDNRRPATHD